MAKLSVDDLLKLYSADPQNVPAPLPPSGQSQAVQAPAFDDLVKLYSAPQPVAPINADGALGQAAAATGSYVRDIPVAGPAIYSGLEKTAAYARSKIHGTKYDDELSAIRRYQDAAEKQNPVSATVGGVTGSIAPMLPVAATATGARALGIAGNSLMGRAGVGAITNAAIGGADTAARGGDVGQIAGGAGVGGTFGLLMPGAGAAIGGIANRLVSPAVDAATNRLIQRAAELGIPLRAAQTSTSPFIQKLDQMVGQLPASGRGGIAGAQRESVTRAVARTFGEDTGNLTPDIMASARDRVGHVFESVADRTPVIHAGDEMGNGLMGIVRDAQSSMTPGEVEPIVRQVQNIASLVDRDTGTLTGQQYLNLTKRNSPLDRAMRAPNSSISAAAHDIRDVLDSALERSASPEVLADLRQARAQWRNMRTVEPLVADSPDGTISPLKLQNAVASKNKGTYGMAYGGGGDLADIARIGRQFFRTPPDSGTPTGTLIMNQLVRHGGLIAGAGLAGAGYYKDWDPAALGLGIAGLGGSALLARSISPILNQPQVLNRLVSRSVVAAPPANRLLVQDAR